MCFVQVCVEFQTNINTIDNFTLSSRGIRSCIQRDFITLSFQPHYWILVHRFGSWELGVGPSGVKVLHLVEKAGAVIDEHTRTRKAC